MKVGLYFGTFNPIHVGHLIIANTMAENTDLDKVWFVVTPSSPFKKDETLLHEFDRYDMVEAACYENPNFDVSDIEFNLPKPNYTINTLTHLKERHPNHDFVLIIGEDNLVHFNKWKNYDKILEYFSLYVYPRSGYSDAELLSHSKVKVVNAPLLNISATYIRKEIEKGNSIRYLVPDVVLQVINRKKFYSKA